MRLHSFLLGVNLLIFVLPLAGLLGGSVLDRQLARQTHGELAALGSALAVGYREAVLARIPVEERATYGRSTAHPDPLRRPDLITQSLEGAARLPAAAPAASAALPPDPIARTAGSAICTQVQALREATRAGARLLDFRGTVVCSSGGEIEESLREREEVVIALGGEVASALRRRTSNHPSPPLSSPSRETGWRVFLALPVIDGETGRVLGAVVVSRTPLSPLKALWQERVPLLLMAALLLVVVVLVTLLTQAVILRPMRRLLAQAQRGTAGRMDPAELAAALQTVESPVEVGQISRALSAMAQALAARARYVRDFTTALSHELKTPLTSMRGAVELMQDHRESMSPAQHEAFLRQLAEDVARMERLVRRSLDQVRADPDRRSEQRCDVRAVLMDLATRHAGDTILIDLKVEEGLTEAAISADTLDAILAPLLDNARQHGRAGRSQVRAELHARRDNSAIHIELADDGPGIPAEHAAKLFLPFFTTAREQGGTGLGLHFARVLAESMGGSLELVSADAPADSSAARGARFRLILPS